MLMLGPGDTMTEKADMMQENLEEEQILFHQILKKHWVMIGNL